MTTTRTTNTESVDAIVAAIHADGYAVIDGLWPQEDVASARAELHEILAATPRGRDDFEGRKTRRVYALFGKTRRFDGPATNPVILEILDRVLGEYQLSAPTGIEIGAGEVAQPLHPDDALYPIPRPHPELVVNVMWPLDDFTEENGATRIVAGSHRWIDERPGPGTDTIAIEMPAGATLVYLGSLWHGGGANRTDRSRLGVVLHYGVAWLRPVENHVLAVAPEVVAGLSPRMQELLGYNICSPFVGYVDGRHPRRLLDCLDPTTAPGART